MAYALRYGLRTIGGSDGLQPRKEKCGAEAIAKYLASEANWESGQLLRIWRFGFYGSLIMLAQVCVSDVHSAGRAATD